MAALMAMALAAACPTLAPAQLKDHLRPEGDTKLVFFASWCSDCRESLGKEQPPGTLFIAAFDEREAAEKVIARFRPDATCFTSDAIAEQFRVKSLPAVVTVGPDGTPR
jgi:thiol-disulfide isomerase/thioredoxin